MHAAALYQRSGEELLTASATDPALREKTLGILADRMTPDEIEETTQALKTEQGAAGLVSAPCLPILSFSPSNSGTSIRIRHPGWERRTRNWTTSTGNLRPMRTPSACRQTSEFRILP